MNKLIIYTDGASRGNPGKASIGVVFCDQKGETIKTYGQAIGITTNNEAEYQAVIFALKKSKALFGKEKIKEYDIEVRSDSQLMVSQLRGEYKIIEPKIQSLFMQAWNLRVEIGKTTFTLIPREENRQADRAANEALDKEVKSLF
ncbi:MAG: ribonuclease HI family protein [Candidatus Paceibacterota bacterium]|jgi:ribonuclease HI